MHCKAFTSIIHRRETFEEKLICYLTDKQLEKAKEMIDEMSEDNPNYRTRVKS